MDAASDIPTGGALTAGELLRTEFPRNHDQFLSSINVADLFEFQPRAEHPLGLPE